MTSPHARSRAGHRILLVEDDPFQAAYLTRYLEKQGFDIDGPWHDERSALRQVESDPPDLALLDIDLRGIDIHQGPTSARIAQTLELWNIPYVFITSHADISLVGLRGNAPKLSKPVNPELLVQRIDSMLGEVERAP